MLMQLMESKPLVSVLISAYNSEKTISNSIDSIIRQTFKDFELIIIDDGSTDNTYKIINKYSKIDKRIKVFKNSSNKGLTWSLNYGVSLSKSNYIVRQDSDDESVSDRIYKQYNIIKKNDGPVLIGCQIYEIRNNKKILWTLNKNINLNKMIKYKNLFAHSSVIFKKNVFLDVGGYDNNYIVSQDFELWIRMSKLGKIGYIYEPLVNRYFQKNSISETKKFLQLYNSIKARFKNRKGSNYILILFYSIIQLLLIITPNKFVKAIKKII